MRCENCGTEWSIAIQGNSIQKYCPVCGKPVIQVKTTQLTSLEETLLVIARDYGLGNLQDGVRAMAYFSDLAPHLRKEKVMLQHLIQCNGNSILIAALQKPPHEQQLCLNQLVSKLMDDLFVSEAAANLICSSFWNAITIASAPKVKEPTPEELYNQSCELEKSDIKAALRLLTKAAEAGYFSAQAKLAKWYRDGKLISKNPEKSFYWYKEAAKSGDPETKCNLGWCYATGFGCEKNPFLSAVYFYNAASAGVVAAQYNFAKCLELGNGEKKDIKRAAAFYEKAAKAGHIKSQYCLGKCYEYGNGVNKDIAMAVFWYKKAAQNGLADAQFAMGQCYELGKGFDKDPNIAYYWYKQASDNGHPEAKQKLVKLI